MKRTTRKDAERQGEKHAGRREAGLRKLGAETAQHLLGGDGGVQEEGGLERGEGSKVVGDLHEGRQLGVAERGEIAGQEESALGRREALHPGGQQAGAGVASQGIIGGGRRREERGEGGGRGGQLQ